MVFLRGRCECSLGGGERFFFVECIKVDKQQVARVLRMSKTHDRRCSSEVTRASSSVFLIYRVNSFVGAFILVCVALLGVSLSAQPTVIATSGGLKVPSSFGSIFPVLPVIGQSATGSVSMGVMTAYAGIDFVRMLLRVQSTVSIELPNTTIPVGASVRIPIVVRKSNSLLPGVRVEKVDLRFVYQCEVIDLFGVSEEAQNDGGCVARMALQLSGNPIDTFWVDGLSKLCGKTSTPLLASYAMGYANRGSAIVIVENGELRQVGHCVTEGSTRLVFSDINMSALSSSMGSIIEVTLESNSQHNGELYVFNIAGNEVHRRSVHAPGAVKVTEKIDASQLAPGLYTLSYNYVSGVSSISVLVHK